MHDQLTLQQRQPTLPTSAVPQPSSPVREWTGREATPTLIGPLAGEHWFGSHGPRACLVRMELQLSAEMMVAALFAAGLFVTAEDVADDGQLFGFIAQVLGQEGLGFLEAAAENLPALERSGTLPAAGGATGADWLAFCRRRIAALTAMPPARLACGEDRR